jgi:hypothetical protein
MLVSSLRRIVAKTLTKVASALNPIPPIEVVELGPRLVPYQPTPMRRQRPVQVFRPDPKLVADMDAIEAECEDLFRSLEDEATHPGLLN